MLPFPTEQSEFAGRWQLTKDGDPDGLRLYERHYSCRPYKDGRVRHLFVGPGYKMVLLLPGKDALLVWRKFINRDPQDGVCCSVFRNESTHLSSDLIQQAMRLAWERWPGERLYTYVNETKIRSVNPGYCFKRAGWQVCKRRTKGGLLVLELLP